VLCASPHDPRGMVGMEAMSDPAKLREALAAYRVDADAGKWMTDSPVFVQAARDYLALLESDAIVIRREYGEWPEWAQRIIADVVADPDEDYLAPMQAVGILDALAESSKETPEVEKNQLGMW
jgi:hypothetical protein